jgi:hypothetical protein
LIQWAGCRLPKGSINHQTTAVGDTAKTRPCLRLARGDVVYPFPAATVVERPFLSRVIPCGHPGVVRGFPGPRLLIVDEAAMVHDDQVFTAVLPMSAVSRGRLICWGALFSLRGWFPHTGRPAGPERERVKVRESECLPIGKSFSGEQERLLSPR